MDVHTLTGLRVYAVLVAVLAEGLRASLVWPTTLARVLWLFEFHWALTTPLLLATVVPSASVVATFTIISSLLTVVYTVLTLLAFTVAFRCGVNCLSTLPYDLIRVGALTLLTTYSFFASVYWVRSTGSIAPLRREKRLSLLVLLGAVPAAVLFYSQRWYFILPAFAFDPSVFWLVHIDRPYTNGVAFVAVVLLAVLDVLHLILFIDGPYLFNVLIFRTLIDVGRIYLRLITI